MLVTSRIGGFSVKEGKKEEEDRLKFDIPKAVLEEWTKSDDTLQTTYVYFLKKSCVSEF